MPGPGSARVVLHWLPLGAGGPAVVRGSGRLYERLAALRRRRRPLALYHAALEVTVDGVRHVVEMAPAWQRRDVARGVAVTGPVGLRGLGHLRAFRYEVRCWPDGVIPDLAAAVGGPRVLATDDVRAARLLALVPEVPARTWGRDALGSGDMWNSNSVVAWLLATSGHDAGVAPPAGGRAPGWAAGLATARGSVQVCPDRDLRH
jgi:hypothetical protein